MIRAGVLLLALLLAGCGPSGCIVRAADLPAKPPATPAAPAAPPAHPAPPSGNQMADGVSNARPVDVVSWLLPWLAGILTVATVGTVAVAAWLGSKTLGLAALGLLAGLGTVLVLKVALWVLGILAGVAVLLLVGYLARELWIHRRAIAALDPLHDLIRKKSKATP